MKGDLKYNASEISFMVFPCILPLSRQTSFPRDAGCISFWRATMRNTLSHYHNCCDCDSAMKMHTRPATWTLSGRPVEGTSRDEVCWDPLSETLRVLSFSSCLFSIGIVTIGELSFCPFVQWMGLVAPGPSYVTCVITVALHSDSVWEAWLAQFCWRGLWALRFRKVKWLSWSHTAIGWYSWGQSQQNSLHCGGIQPD